jgi:hypothetical protein
MIRKNLLTIAAATAMVAAGTLSARASFVLTLDDGIHPSISIEDGGAGDGSAKEGAISWMGSLGVWTLNFDTGLSKPAIGSASQPSMDLDFVAISSAAGSLTITLSDTGFGPIGNSGLVLLSAGGTLASGGTLNVSGQLNDTTVVSLAPITVAGISYSGDGETSAVLSSPFTLQETVILTHGANDTDPSSGDVHLRVVVPEPTTMMAGALLLLPFGASTLRILRKKQTA